MRLRAAGPESLKKYGFPHSLPIWKEGGRGRRIARRQRMDINEAKSYANRSVVLGWTDRNGDVVNERVFVFEVNFVPFYGPCFVTSNGDIRLDRVVHCQAADVKMA